MKFSLSAFLMKALLPAALILSASTVEAAATVNKKALGPLTSLAAKSKVCNVLDYGGVADGKTDIGPAISKAFTSCVSGSAATLYIPEGEYSLATGVKLNGGSGWALQIDGLLTLTSGGTFGGNAFVIQNGNDIEVFSSTNKGAINGQGYIARRDKTGQNARLMRFINVSNLSVHNLIYVDSPTFHLVFNGVSNLDMYYITIRGPDIGGSDGIDLICTDNCHLHDFEVTNRDECVSVKTPSNNALIEDALCNHSGGMSIGSLTADISSSADASAVSNITMRNIYTYKSTQSLMIKTFPGGSGAVGYVKDSLFENFWSYGGAYVLDVDQYWQSKTTPDTGAVALSGLTFRNWTGSMSNGASRGAVIIRGSDIVPVQDVTIEGFNMWTESGNRVVNQCKNVYGTGECIKAAQGDATYTTTVTKTAAPTGWVKGTAPTWGVEGYGVTVAIPVYTPAVRYPVASSGLLVAGSAPSPTSKVGVVSSRQNSPSTTSVRPISTAPVSSTPTSASLSTIVDPVSGALSSTPPAVTSYSTTYVSESSSASSSIASPSVNATSTTRSKCTKPSTFPTLSSNATTLIPPSTTSTKSRCTGGPKPSGIFPSGGFPVNGTLGFPTAGGSSGFLTRTLISSAASSVAATATATSYTFPSVTATATATATPGNGAGPSGSNFEELLAQLIAMLTQFFGGRN